MNDFAGGEAEAQAAYQAAMTACFSDEANSKGHCSMQVHTSRKTGKPKWTMLEMWPMLVCISSSTNFSVVLF